MSIEITDNGIIKIIQGDTGIIPIPNIPTDKNYEVYLAIRKKDRSLVTPEIMKNSNYQDKVEFKISKQISELLTIPANAKCGLYYWGVKLCDANTGLEDTMVLGGYFGRWNPLYSYPKLVEGITDESSDYDDDGDESAPTLSERVTELENKMSKAYLSSD